MILKSCFGVCLMLLLFLTGCFSPKADDNLKSTMDKQYESIDNSGKVLNKDRFFSGGKLLILPFKAGANVEASHDLDKASLMIIHGIDDTLKINNSPFEVLSSENAQEAELIMKGYVSALTTPSKIKKWLPGKKVFTMNVEGKIIDQATGEAVFVFNNEVELSESRDVYRKLGEIAGHNIGQFMVIKE